MTNHLFDGPLGRADLNATLVLREGAAPLRYGDLMDLSARLANVLDHRGVGVGDRVAVQVPKAIEAIALYLACLCMGAVFLPLNTAYTATELDYFISDAGAALFVCDPVKAGDLGDIAEQNGAKLATMGAEGSLIAGGGIVRVKGFQPGVLLDLEWLPPSVWSIVQIYP